MEFFKRENRNYQFAISFFQERLSDKTCHLATGHDVVCVFVNDTLSSSVIDTLHAMGIKQLALRSTGYNHVDLRAAKGKLCVVRVPDYSPYSVAEHTVAMMLTLNRKIHKAYAQIKENNFSIEHLLGFDMHGKTVGIIGSGRIGKQVIAILKGFGMNVIAYDVLPKEVEKAGCAYSSLDALLQKSDIISLHCPLTPDSFHMINAVSLAKMKKGVMIINTARGALIDTKALIASLKTQQVGAAGLDVYEEEGAYFFEDLSDTFLNDDTLARLQTFPNVLITSHQGFFTLEAMESIAKTTLENISLFFSGQPPQNVISE